MQAFPPRTQPRTPRACSHQENTTSKRSSVSSAKSAEGFGSERRLKRSVTAALKAAAPSTTFVAKRRSHGSFLPPEVASRDAGPRGRRSRRDPRTPPSLRRDGSSCRPVSCVAQRSPKASASPARTRGQRMSHRAPPPLYAQPDARIDYVFIGSRLHNESVMRVQNAWLAGNGPVDARLADSRVDQRSDPRISLRVGAYPAPITSSRSRN